MKRRSDSSDTPDNTAPSFMAKGNRYLSMPGKYLADLDAIREQARREGVKTLRESGLLKVRQGLTSLEEILSCTNQ